MFVRRARRQPVERDIVYGFFFFCFEYVLILLNKHLIIRRGEHTPRRGHVVCRVCFTPSGAPLNAPTVPAAVVYLFFLFSKKTTKKPPVRSSCAHELRYARQTATPLFPRTTDSRRIGKMFKYVYLAVCLLCLFYVLAAVFTLLTDLISTGVTVWPPLTAVWLPTTACPRPTLRPGEILRRTCHMDGGGNRSRAPRPSPRRGGGGGGGGCPRITVTLRRGMDYKNVFFAHFTRTVPTEACLVVGSSPVRSKHAF